MVKEACRRWEEEVSCGGGVLDVFEVGGAGHYVRSSLMIWLFNKSSQRWYSESVLHCVLFVCLA